MEKVVEKSAHAGESHEVQARNHPVLKGVMQVLFILTLILLVFVVKLRG
jgi:hypothetical protein